MQNDPVAAEIYKNQLCTRTHVHTHMSCLPADVPVGLWSIARSQGPSGDT